MTQAQRLTGVVTDHGEGPAWHAREQRLKFVDMLAGDLLTLREDGGVDRSHVATVAAAWRERSTGGVAVAVERGFMLHSAAGEVEWSVEAWTDPTVRMNDGACDPQGRFYCGCMSYDARPGAGVMWRLDPDRSVHRVRGGLTIANGLAWSRDGSGPYHIDTATGQVDSYAFDAGAGMWGERHTVVEVLGGAPDGMALDAEGGLWVALWDGSAVHRYSRSGELTAVVNVSSRQVTACAFGGADLDLLYITTSRHGLTAGDDPAAGSLFVADVGVRGEPLMTFAG